MSISAQYGGLPYQGVRIMGWTCYYCKAWVTLGAKHVCPMMRRVLTPPTVDPPKYYIYHQKKFVKDVTYHLTCPHCKKKIELTVKEAE